jgi:hypothetical protein
METWKANQILHELIEPHRTLVSGAVIYDDQNGPCSMNGVLSSQVYRIGSYLTHRMDLIFYSDGSITSYFILDGEIADTVSTFDFRLYQLSCQIADFMEIDRPFRAHILPEIVDATTIQLPNRICYGECHYDEEYVYRIVTLSRRAYSKMKQLYPKRLLAEGDCVNVGIKQSSGWEHIFSNAKRTTVVFRKPF